MNVRKRIAIAVSAALLVVVVAVSASFASRGVELWSDTAAFSELGPGEEAAFPRFVSVTDAVDEVQYVLSYGSSGLNVEFGLRAGDGTEYAISACGGGGSGIIGGVPSGEYELFVRHADHLSSGLDRRSRPSSSTANDPHARLGVRLGRALFFCACLQ